MTDTLEFSSSLKKTNSHITQDKSLQLLSIDQQNSTTYTSQYMMRPTPPDSSILLRPVPKYILSFMPQLPLKLILPSTVVKDHVSSQVANNQNQIKSTVIP